ncbi:MAG: hypothetical protein AAF693_17315 [Bacteroidota bacterium]
MPQQSSFIATDTEKRRGIIILTNVNGRRLFINPETPEMSSQNNNGINCFEFVKSIIG